MQSTKNKTKMPPHVEERLKTPVTIFEGVTGIDPYKKTTIGELFALISLEREDWIDQAEALREAKENDPTKYKALKADCFGFIPGEFSQRNKDGLQKYVPLLCVDIDNSQDPAATIEKLKAIQYVYAAFPSPSYKGVRALVWSNSTPETHEAAFLDLCNEISSLTGIPINDKSREHIDPSRKAYSCFWFFSYVPKGLLYRNDNSSIFEYQPKQIENHENQKINGSGRPAPAHQVNGSITIDDRVEAAWRKLEDSNTNANGRNDLAFQLACHIIEHRVESPDRIEDEMRKINVKYPGDHQFTDEEITASRKSAEKKTGPKYTDKEIINYLDIGRNGRKAPQQKKQADQGKPEPEEEPQEEEATNGDSNKEKIPIDKIEEALKLAYEFRVNTVKGLPEFREKGKGEWTAITDFNLNSIVRKLKKQNLKGASKEMISTLLNSEFAPQVDPITKYFESLEWDKKDHIETLCRTVDPVGEKEEASRAMFKKYLTKWLVAAIANVFDKKVCRNHQCFILAGPQGAGKSTWIKKLCPPKLEPYYVEQGLDPDNKDSQLDTTTNFIFNLDDYFAATTSKKINEFKGIITKNVVKVRMPYGRYPEERAKICSFVASSNEAQFLHDPTGNRRFVPFEVSAIHLDKLQEININKTWAQAYQLYKSGFQYWLSKADQVELNKHNEQFEVRSAEFELLDMYYKPAEAGEEAEYMDTRKLTDELLNFTKQKLSIRKVGEAARKLGFEKKSYRDGDKVKKMYAVVRINCSEKNEISPF